MWLLKRELPRTVLRLDEISSTDDVAGHNE